MKQDGISPLGEVALDRYRPGAWPTALLERMVMWANRMNTSGRLLDLGCAEGYLLERLERPGVGLDMNPVRLRIAHDKGLKVCNGDGNRLPYPDQSFDTVISMEVLEHVPDMSLMMAEVYRVLRPGGNWVISVPNVTLRSWYEMWREKKPYYCDVDEHYREFSPVDLPWFEHRFMHPSAFEAMFEDAGFSIRHRDGVRYLLPQWFSRVPPLQRTIESPRADRFWAHVPGIRAFPYWMIRVVGKA